MLKNEKITVIEGPDKEGKFMFFCDWDGPRGRRGQVFRTFLPADAAPITTDKRQDQRIPLDFSKGIVYESLPEGGLKYASRAGDCPNFVPG